MKNGFSCLLVVLFAVGAQAVEFRAGTSEIVVPPRTPPVLAFAADELYVEPYLLNATGTVWYDGVALEEIKEEK